MGLQVKQTVLVFGKGHILPQFLPEYEKFPNSRHNWKIDLNFSYYLLLA